MENPNFNPQFSGIVTIKIIYLFIYLLQHLYTAQFQSLESEAAGCWRAKMT